MCQLFGCDSGAGDEGLQGLGTRDFRGWERGTSGNEGLQGLGTRDFTLQSDNVHAVGCEGGTGEEGVEKRLQVVLLRGLLK